MGGFMVYKVDFLINDLNNLCKSKSSMFVKNIQVSFKIILFSQLFFYIFISHLSLSLHN
mgnify:CR=1